MNLADRVFLTFYSLCLAVFSLLVIAVASGWREPLAGLQASLTDPQWRWVLGTLGAIFFAFSVRFLSLGFRSRYAGRAVSHETSLGQVRISLVAVENLVRRVAKQCVGVREVKAWVRSLPAGLAVDLRLVVSPDLSIPRVSDEAQKCIQQYVRDVVGVEVAEVRVVVENIGSEPRRRVE